jgi:hypothetical protein
VEALVLLLGLKMLLVLEASIANILGDFYVIKNLASKMSFTTNLHQTVKMEELWGPMVKLNSSSLDHIARGLNRLPNNRAKLGTKKKRELIEKIENFEAWS